MQEENLKANNLIMSDFCIAKVFTDFNKDDIRGQTKIFSFELRCFKIKNNLSKF